MKPILLTILLVALTPLAGQAETPTCKPSLLCSLATRFCESNQGCPQNVPANSIYYEIMLFKAESGQTFALAPVYTTEKGALAALQKLEASNYCIQMPIE